jgi:hypothetical protein
VRVVVLAVSMQWSGDKLGLTGCRRWLDDDLLAQACRSIQGTGRSLPDPHAAVSPICTSLLGVSKTRGVENSAAAGSPVAPAARRGAVEVRKSLPRFGSRPR